MTTQEKIDVLEKAIPLIDHNAYGTIGICYAIFLILYGDSEDDDWMGEETARFIKDCGIELPVVPDSVYSFPLTPEGDEERRAFLRSHIERLKKTL